MHHIGGYCVKKSNPFLAKTIIKRQNIIMWVNQGPKNLYVLVWGVKNKSYKPHSIGWSSSPILEPLDHCRYHFNLFIYVFMVAIWDCWLCFWAWKPMWIAAMYKWLWRSCNSACFDILLLCSYDHWSCALVDSFVKRI